MGRQGVFVLFPIRPAEYERDINVTFTTSNSLPASGVRPSCCKAKQPYTTLRLGHIFLMIILAKRLHFHGTLAHQETTWASSVPLMATQTWPQIVKDIQANQVVFMCSRRITPMSGRTFFSSYRNAKKAITSSCHHVIMSSCHHAVKDFGTQGERVMRLGVRHGLATLRDNMGTGESDKKKRMEQPPEGSFHPPFFRF